MYRIADKILDFAERNASRFVIISMLWLCLLLCIEISKTLI
jgi:hypothetical protein